MEKAGEAEGGGGGGTPIIDLIRVHVQLFRVCFSDLLYNNKVHSSLSFYSI